VAIDPNDGSVLAMVSKPAFDANLFVHGISGEDYRNTKAFRYPGVSALKDLSSDFGRESLEKLLK